MGAKITTPLEVGFANIKTGAYTGDGLNFRQLDIADLAAKENVWLLIKSLTNVGEAVHRIEYGQDDLSMFMSATADVGGEIKSFPFYGAQLGLANNVNADGVIYRYIAIWTEP